MTQILSNLLNNATKYTPDGGEISIVLTIADGSAVIRLRDNGLGIPADAVRVIATDDSLRMAPDLLRAIPDVTEVRPGARRSYWLREALAAGADTGQVRAALALLVVLGLVACVVAMAPALVNRLDGVDLMPVAARVGSDVPFFVSGAAFALVRGRGDLVVNILVETPTRLDEHEPPVQREADRDREREDQRAARELGRGLPFLALLLRRIVRGDRKRAEADRKRLAERDHAADHRQPEDPVPGHRRLDRLVDLGDVSVWLADGDGPVRCAAHHHALQDGLSPDVRH